MVNKSMRQHLLECFRVHSEMLLLMSMLSMIPGLKFLRYLGTQVGFLKALQEVKVPFRSGWRSQGTGPSDMWNPKNLKLDTHPQLEAVRHS